MVVKSPAEFLESDALRMYCDLGSLRDAQKVFDEMRHRDLVSWVIMMAAYVERGDLSNTVGLFLDMLECGVRPIASIFTGLLKSLDEELYLEFEKQLHSYVIRSGKGGGSVETAIANMYVKHGLLEGVRLVFDQMWENKSVVAWTGLTVGYTEYEKLGVVLELFAEMIRESVEVDEFVFSIVLKACASLEELNAGRKIHGYSVKLGLDSEVFVGTPLVDFYEKCGEFESALCNAGCHINDHMDSPPEEEATVCRGMSQSYYNSRVFSVVSQSMSGYNSSSLLRPGGASRSHSLPSGLNEVWPSSSANQNGSACWVQAGDLNGLRGQLEKLRDLYGGSMPLTRVPCEYLKVFGRPLYISEYGAFKLVNLFRKLGDTIAVDGKGQKKFVYFQNLKPSPTPSHLISTGKDYSRKGKGTQEESMAIVTGNGSSEEFSEEERVISEEHDHRSQGQISLRTGQCETDDNDLEHCKYELQEILVTYNDLFMLGCFEFFYQQKFKKQLDCQRFGVDQLASSIWRRVEMTIVVWVLLSMIYDESESGKLPSHVYHGPELVLALVFDPSLLGIYSVYTLERYGDMDMKPKRVVPLDDDIFMDADEELMALACVDDDAVIMLLGMKLIAYHVKAEMADIIHSYTTASAGYAAFRMHRSNLSLHSLAEIEGE